MATRVKKIEQGAEVPPSPLKRVRRSSLDENPAGEQAGNSYFADSRLRTGLEFFSSGCVLLDQVLGGGWTLGRMENVIGDKSTGKTLLAIEACVNFLQKFPDGLIRYGEAESAFDKPYAEALGMPVDRIEWVDFLKTKPKRAAARPRDEEDEAPASGESESDRTVEFLFEDVTRTIAKAKGRPILYIVDSLDALSDRAELERKDGESTMGMNKAKKLHEMFRRGVGDIEKARMCLLIISQIKDKIGVSFGETKMRTGGHAMDFFASHCLWLAHIGRIKKTVDGIERVIGIEIKAQCKKNKVGLPFRECTFNLLFGYGIDDLSANVEWLLDHGLSGRLAEVDMTKSGYKTRIQALRNRGGQEVKEVRSKLNAIVVDEWTRIEKTFLPQSGKY